MRVGIKELVRWIREKQQRREELKKRNQWEVRATQKTEHGECEFVESFKNMGDGIGFLETVLLDETCNYIFFTEPGGYVTWQTIKNPGPLKIDGVEV